VKLLHLKGKNFRSFAEFELDLNAAGLFSVTGPNGAGKSSIFSAVEWALFGGKRGPGAQRVLRQGADGEECRVELEFEVAGRTLRVVRVDHDDAWLVDVASSEELARGLTGTSHEVAVQLGLTQDMFGGTFYARQKEVQALSSSNKLGDRRDQLERLLGIEHLRVAADLAARDAREQKALVEGLREDAPDVDVLRGEVERCEREAQQAAPAITHLETEVSRLDAALKETTSRIDALTMQISEHGSRQVSAEHAAGELVREQTVLDGLRQRLDDAQAAQVELLELEPVAARADEISALEREMDLRRRNHEQIEQLRARERLALEQLAMATDALNDLGDLPEGPDPGATLSAAQQKLNDLGEKLRHASEARQRANEHSRNTDELLDRVKNAETIDRELCALTDADVEIGRAHERRQELRGVKAEVEAQLAHDVKHREALTGVDDSDIGTCPTCHRPLEGSLADLIAEFDASVVGHKARLASLAIEADGLIATARQYQLAAERASQLRAQREALGDTGDRNTLEANAAEAATEARDAAHREHELDVSYRNLGKQIPLLRAAAEQAATDALKRAAGREEKTRAQQQAATYAEQLRQTASNGYDPAAHKELQADLSRTQEAVRRCAALRENAGALQLLEGRVATQAPVVEEMIERVRQLRERAAELAPEENAHETATAERDRLIDELDQARRALDNAKQQVSVESQAVNAARTRLADGRKILKRIDREHRELELRSAVAKALSDYREHASKRARPSLEKEASNMLKQVTGATYPIIRLTESYLLEIADGGEFHSIKRFSGGEQDLAALCLRLALSRTLARQRGVEHGFVILDEVFGSQDIDRRRLLMEQLGELAKTEFQQIFVISHTDDVIEHCSLHIAVTRENGISNAEGPTA
jgi:exonuclease SbcC